MESPKSAAIRLRDTGQWQCFYTDCSILEGQVGGGVYSEQLD